MQCRTIFSYRWSIQADYVTWQLTVLWPALYIFTFYYRQPCLPQTRHNQHLRMNEYDSARLIWHSSPSQEYDTISLADCSVSHCSKHNSSRSSDFWPHMICVTCHANLRCMYISSIKFSADCRDQLWRPRHSELISKT